MEMASFGTERLILFYHWEEKNLFGLQHKSLKHVELNKIIQKTKISNLLQK